MYAEFWTWHGWDALVALGTLALAGATASLAWKTRDVATQAGEDVRAQWRPVLLPPRGEDLAAEWLSEDRGGLLILYLRNVGRGPALDVRVEAGLAGG